MGNKAVYEGLKHHDDLVKKRVLFTEVRNRADSTQYRLELGNNNYRYEDNLTYIVDLRKGKKHLFQSFKKDRRKNIRKAKKMGVVIKEIEHVDQVSIFYDIIKKAYNRKKVPLADISLFQNSFNLLAGKGMFKIFLAQFGDEWIGGQAILSFKNSILAWYGAARQQCSYLHPNEVLTWHVIKWGISNGFHAFDLGGAGKPGENYGVRDFKERFGGKELNYGRYIRIYNPLLYHIAKASYTASRNLINKI
jgi:lipid II:glycine glycyltransferase (peptidoglycan interpeptide bridge formation enzyme)